MEKITRFSVRYPISILMMVLGIMLLGYLSLGRLGVDLFPDLANPRLFVQLVAGEQPPAEIEAQYVEALESAVSRLAGVEDVQVELRTGKMDMTIDYSWQQDMNNAFLELQRAIAPFRQSDGIDEVYLSRYDPSADPVVLLAMYNPKVDDANILRKTAEEYVAKSLIRIDGVADVQLAGQEEAEIAIVTDKYKLDAMGLTVEEIAAKIASVNTNVSGGNITEQGIRYSVKGLKTVRNLYDVRNLIVGFKELDNGQGSNTSESRTTRVPIFLYELAEVTMKNKEPDNIVYFNGQRCLALSIYKELRFNTVDVVEKVTKQMKIIDEALPDYHFEVISNQGDYINEAIGEVEESALIGVCLAIIILFVFLRRLQTTLIVSLAIPISIIATFNLMYFNGLSINIMTLGGLALGAGMLVDNAIVVLENIIRNIDEGMSPKEAAIKGTAEVSGAISAATLTTIIVFLPIVYLHGPSGELFKEQAWTVAFSLLSSLFVAILVLPMLCSLLIKVQPTKPKHVKGFRWYGKFLDVILKLRYVVILLAFVLIGITYLLLPMLGSEFMPKSNTGSLELQMSLPSGSTLEKTDRVMQAVDFVIRERLGDQLLFSYCHAGKNTSSSSSENLDVGTHTAEIKIQLEPGHQMTAGELITDLRAQLSELVNVDFTFKPSNTALPAILGVEEAPIVLEVYGKELEEINHLTAELAKHMRALENIFGVEIEHEDVKPEVNLQFDRVRAGVFGVNVGEVSMQVKDALEGRIAGNIELSGEMKTISIQIPEYQRHELGEIEVLVGGTTYRLGELASIHEVDAQQQISRKRQSRVGRIRAQIKEGVALDHAVQELDKAIAQVHFPPHYKVEISGEEQKRKESFDSLAFALFLSIVLVYMVMASQFESLLHPFTILLTIPLACVGSVLLFLILGESLNIMAYIGMIMLVGIAVNDSIILVDTIRRLRMGGMSLRMSVIEAGVQRFRPIVMTSLTTILALFPMMIGFGESAALRSPMAIAVVGGLVTSTLLTLVVIPCLYYVLDSLFSTQKN